MSTENSVDFSLMPKLDLLLVIERLNRAYGPQDWWPADDAFEMIVGAILTQRVAWRNAETAVGALRSADLLSVGAIHAMAADELAERIRPSGFYRAKARTLKAMAAYVDARHGGRAEWLRLMPLQALRGDLLNICGIGPETADAILVYAADKASFVVDAYTVRLLTRLEGTGKAMSYERVRKRFMKALPADAALYGQAHAVLVRHGQRVCTKRMPRCGECSLADQCLYGRLAGSQPTADDR